MAETIPAILQKYQTQKRAAGYSQDTIDRVVRNVAQYSRDMHVQGFARFTTESALLWGSKKLSAGCSSSTVYAYYNSLRSFAGFAESVGVSTNIDRTRLRCRPHYVNRTVLKPFQVRRAIMRADWQTAVLIRLMYTTGARLSEAISITKDQVTESTDLTIQIVGKGGKVRPIFITKPLREQLMDLLTGESDFCFTDDKGDQLTRTAAYYHIKKALTLAGYGYASPHSLRRTFATVMLTRGADIVYVSRMMGHSSVAITQIYTRLLTDDIKRIHKKYLVEL